MSNNFGLENPTVIAYLDNAATTKPCDAAINAAMRCMNENYGNPSSLHGIGLAAELEVSAARKAISSALGALEGEIIFTSGATESNNTAILCNANTCDTLSRKFSRGRQIVTSSIEHPSVEQAMVELERRGFEMVRLSPVNGEITADRIVDAVNENTALVSMMLVCNENGYILPISQAFSRIQKKYPNVITHCDAVQAFGKLKLSSRALNADFISLSAHKLHGIKGVGALYKSSSARLFPFMFGGGQEKGLRSGTEATPAIAAFGAAVSEIADDTKSQKLYDYAKSKLSQLDFITLNIPQGACSPYILNFSVKGIRSEIMLHYLEARGVYVSSGSACSKGQRSSVLKEFGASDKQADSAIRISFSRFTMQNEVDMLIEGLIEGERTLIHK